VKNAETTVDIRTKNTGGTIDPRPIRRRALRLLEALGGPPTELSILLCDDDVIHELNRSYRSIDRPTDVLAFPLLDHGEDPPEAPRALGDVVISVETAARQARRRRRPLLAEVTTLLIHGVLHLLGHDHQGDREKRVMDALARRLEQEISGVQRKPPRRPRTR